MTSVLRQSTYIYAIGHFMCGMDLWSLCANFEIVSFKSLLIRAQALSLLSFVFVKPMLWSYYWT